MTELTNKWKRIIADSRVNQTYVGAWVLMTSSLTVALHVTVLCVVYLSTTPSGMMARFVTLVQVASFCAALTLILIGIAGALTAHRVAENRRRLIEVLKKVREGDLSARLSYPIQEELGDLEEAFNETIAGLQRRVCR